MRSRAVVLFALAALAGCSRDLAVPPRPSIEPLGTIPSFQAVAPRQGIHFAAAGGVGPYAFDFAQGGRLSGADASIDASGVYTAGSAGSAQDVVEVTDARGTKATATVSVGQRIAITPAFTGTVPGGRILFQATGGTGAYAFVAGTSGSGGDVTPSGTYTAGSAGDTIDTVMVRDEPDLGTYAKAEIHVGAALQLYRSDTRPVAPGEPVTFLAFNGQPPYTFALAGTPGSGNATINPASGLYVAGDRGADPDPYAVTSDVVTVTDSATVRQTATLVVPVGARLRLVLDSTEVFPGQRAQLVASGGKPPYAFGFAARVPAGAPGPLADPQRRSGGNGGNRSRGTVSALTGEYVPGFSPGAVDWFQVTDATGAPAAILAGPRVGSLPLAVGAGVRGCTTGDLNGDGSEDFLLTMSGDGTDRFVTGMLLDTAAPWLQSYFLDSGGAPAFTADFGGSGRRSVAFVGGDSRCDSGSWCPGLDFWALTPDLVGYLSRTQLSGGGPQQSVTVYNDPLYQNAAGTAYHTETTNWSIRRGAGRYDAASRTWQFWGPGWDGDTVQTTLAPSPGPYVCSDPTFQYDVDAWLVRMDWKAGAAQPARPVCVKAKGFCPTCSGASHHGPVAMAAGDFDGDGLPDLAWILDTDGNRVADGAQGARLYVAMGLPGGGFGAPASGWPDGTSQFQIADGGTFQPRFQVVRPPSGLDAVLVRLVDPSSRRGTLFLVRDPSDWSAKLDASVDGFVAGGPAASAMTTAVAGQSFYAWSGDDGTVIGFALRSLGLGFTAPSTAAILPFSVNSVCLPDVNADGVPDLLAASDLGATAHLVLGDGSSAGASSGTFGQLVHQRGLAFPVVTGDFDGDGFLDAVVANGSGAGITVMWGGGGQLAWGTQLSSAAISAAVAADYTGEGRPSVLFQEKSGRFGKLRSRGDGTFDPAVALSAWSSTGGPAEASFFAWAADLHTSAPGVDALTFGQKGSGMQARALLVQDGQVVDVAAKAVPPLDAVRIRTEDCWPLAVGGSAGLPPGVAPVALACGHASQDGSSSRFAVWGALLRNVDAAPGPDGTPPPQPAAFDDWVLVTSTTSGTDPACPLACGAFSAPVPAGARIRTAMIGTLDPTGGTRRDTAVYLFATDRVYAVEVGTNGDPLHPASWKVTVFPVTPSLSGFYPFLATAGHLTADPTVAFDAIVAGGNPQGGIGAGGAVVVRRTAAGYELVQQLGSGGFPIGVGKLADGSPGDALFFVGDWANTGLVPELVPRLNLNDGTGRVR